MKKTISNIFYIMAGGFIWAISLDVFMVPNMIASGGIAGLATVVNHFSAFPVGTFIILFNIPLFAISFKKLGWKFVIQAFFVLLMTSIIIDVSDLFLPVFTEDKLLAAIFGGICSGVGLGLIYMRGFVTGGTDVIALLVEERFPSISYGRMVFILDAIVVIIAAIAFKNWRAALYSAIAIYIMGEIVDRILSGAKTGKLTYIISEKQEEIAKHILENMYRGVTVLHGKGGFTKTDRNVLMIVVRRHELHRLKEIIREIDQKAFVIVGNVAEIAGEGF